jgi:polysaccharide export outer membrane protein
MTPLLAVLVVLAGTPQDRNQSQPRGQTPSPEAAAVAPAPDKGLGYRIGPEDVLQIVVWNNDALTRTVPVRPDGKISLPLLNDVQADGLTPTELRDDLTKKLASYISNPEVSVIVVEVRSFKVSVLGEVLKPGRYDLKSWATVMDALAMAGGPNEYAKRSGIVVMRQNGRRTDRIPFDYDRARSGEGNAINFYLRPGDIVLVP